MRAFPEIQTRLVKLKKELEEANAQVRAEEEAKASEGKSLKETEPSSETPAQDKATEKCDGETPDAQVEIPTLAKEPATKDKATSVSSYASSVASSEGDYFTNETERRDRLDARYTHLKCLHDFMTTELGDLLELRKRIADGTQKDIEFEDLWHLYAPGDVIYSNDNGYHQLYKVYFVSGGQSLKRTRNAQEASEINNMRERLRPWVPPELREDGEDETLEKLLREESSGIGTWTAFKVDCYSMAFDGEYCGPIDVCKKIQPYGTPREITSLPMFPLRFHPRKDELLRELEDRGRRFLFAGGHKSYDGRTIALKRIDSRVEIQSDVYVDFDAYYQDNTSKKPELGKLLRSRQNWAEVQEAASFDELLSCSLTGHEIDSKLSDDFFNANRLSLERFKPLKDEVPSEFLCLMPHYVVGYVFQLREWHHLDLDLIKDIDRDSADARAAGFEDLVIPKRYRDLLVALVDSHASGLQRGEEKKKHASVIQTQIDLVRGKGQGLIILLHGPPGSGKTSTAETIAAYTRRPLYSITCGDIGMTPDVVEKNLLDHTRRADRWGCVLLLDEADVFLVQRDWDSLTRNALVSVFLRQLEYYAGILFLTTNRIGVIDEAFKSRVHISLRYPGVDLESTKIMWSNIMARIEKDNKHSDIQIVFDKEALLEFASKHFEKCRRENVTWNGRQIRNAFQTALALGHYERFDKIREAGMTPEEALATGKKKWRTVKLTKANFQNIAKTAKEFEQYIATVRGSDSMNAQELELRRDNYDPERPQARKQYPSSREAVRDLQSSASASRSKGKRAAKVELPSEDEEDESDSEDLSPEEDD
ncbi:P-loop containing nucleoside triphosphate hydrolase protein [Byssothecium circinans]|uniref:P-loop containing nucleoside triphosphate hydrolase protein n=1 Tax=Byssothecium circinans TaxID=147558 RepID=A0A6A5UL04_9PLEO|nr:P-loop containing nucleoside triphosphate hydrolase protein [Byssothecium circinans]